MVFRKFMHAHREIFSFLFLPSAVRSGVRDNYRMRTLEREEGDSAMFKRTKGHYMISFEPL